MLARERRRARRGTPAGRRATRKVETAYGRHQKLRDHLEAWRLLRERERLAIDAEALALADLDLICEGLAKS